jgi:hypothetical protein
VLMVAVPIAIAFFAACRHRWLQHRLRGDEPLEDRHWRRMARRARDRMVKPGDRVRNSRFGAFMRRWIYCSPSPDAERGEAIEHPAITEAGDAIQERPPTPPPHPEARRASVLRNAVPASGSGWPQNTIPPSGPPITFTQPSFMPRIHGGAIGGGPFVQSPTMEAQARPSISIAPIDSGAPHTRRASHASRTRRPTMVSMGPRMSDAVEGSLNDNIPMAMPVRTSTSGVRKQLKGKKRHSKTSGSYREDGGRASERTEQLPTRDRRAMVSSLLSGLRDGRRAPQNTNADGSRPRSPPTDGVDEQDSPARPSRTYESPLEHMRRSNTVNRVINQTQSFIGGYPDIACLIGTLPDAATMSRPPRSKMGKKRSRSLF